MSHITTEAGRVLKAEFWRHSSAELLRDNIIAGAAGEFLGGDPARFVYITEHAHWIPFVRKYVVHYRYADFVRGRMRELLLGDWGDDG